MVYAEGTSETKLLLCRSRQYHEHDEGESAQGYWYIGNALGTQT